ANPGLKPAAIEIQDLHLKACVCYSRNSRATIICPRNTRITRKILCVTLRKTLRNFAFKWQFPDLTAWCSYRPAMKGERLKAKGKRQKAKGKSLFPIYRLQLNISHLSFI